MDHVISVANIAELKTQPGNVENAVMTIGQAAKGDNFGKFYYFDASDNTTAEDTAFFNVVVPNNGIGRWKAVFTRMLSLPHGTLVINAGKREFYYNGVTAADGTCTVYLTMDGTATGAPIFSTIWFDDSKATVSTATANDAVSSCRKSLSADLKTLVHLFYRGNSSVVSILGATVLGFRTAATGTTVSFAITGK